MRVLVDTGVFLRLVLEPEKLPAPVLDAMDAATERFFSIASAWEIAIKVAIGKLSLPLPVASYVPSRMAALDLAPLPISLAHTFAVATLPDHHRDPFDRLIVAQAMHDDLTILTTDRAFRSYAIRTIG